MNIIYVDYVNNVKDSNKMTAFFNLEFIRGIYFESGSSTVL